MSDKQSPEDPFDLIGTTVGNKYRVDSVIGVGGFGVVYRGQHTGFGEPIAVKCLKLGGELTDDERAVFLSQLKEEGRVLHRLSKLSSGIVQALDVGALTSPNGLWIPYLVMEWLEGQTLAGFLNDRRKSGEGALSLAEAVELLTPVAKALGVAHRQKVAHRDVKPENIHISDVGNQRTVKILDFGIAKVLAQHMSFTAAPAATQLQPSAFTPRYGAPEQFNKKRGATGPWTDVFALALILVELLTGKRALEGDDATQLYVAAADPSARPTPRLYGVDFGDGVEHVIRQALAIDPADRFQNADDFLKALLRACDDVSTDAFSKPAVTTAAGSAIQAQDAAETGAFLSQHELDIPSDPADTKLGIGPGTKQATRRQTAPRSASSRSTRRAHDPHEELAGPDSLAPLSEAQPPSRWPYVVGLAALVGAGVVGVQWLQSRRATKPPLTTTSATSPRPGPTIKASYTAKPRPVLTTGPTASSSAAPFLSATATSSTSGAPMVAPAPPNMVLVEGGAEVAAFFVDAAEVTAGAYKACQDAERCPRADRVVLTPAVAESFGKGATPESLANAWDRRCNLRRGALDQAINCVNHAAAQDYCAFQKKRLPSSAEWTLAAKPNTGSRFPWGDEQPDCKTACFGLNGSCLHVESEVATCSPGKRPRDQSAAGAFDLAGNVSEWVSDKSAKHTTASRPERKVRGGSFLSEPKQLGSQAARSYPATTAFVSIGFRCALSKPSQP